MITHNPDIWTADQRPIVAASLPAHPYGGEGLFLVSDGWAFERFERSGEMAMIPYLRMTGPRGNIIEAALRKFAWVEFTEAGQ